MHWLFKIDTKKESGLGHFFRSLGIAKELLKFSKVSFELLEEDIFFNNILVQESICVVDNSYLETHYDGIFLDGYHYSNEDILFYKNKDVFTVILDDQGINNAAADLTIHPVSAENGFKYAVVQDKFRRSDMQPVNNKVRSLLIMFGGVDSSNMTMRVLDTIEVFCEKNGISIKMVITSRNQYRFDIERDIASKKNKISLLVDDASIDNVIESVDLVIGSGGVSLLERIALRKPSITLLTSENQRLQSQLAYDLGMTILINNLNGFDQEKLLSNLDVLSFDRNARMVMAQNCFNNFDHSGANRIVSKLLANNKNSNENKK